MPIPVSRLVAHASRLFDVSERDILGDGRFRHIAIARHAVALAAKRSGRPLTEISRGLGRCDHSTAANSVMRAEALCERDATYRAKCAALIETAKEFERANAVGPTRYVSEWGMEVEKAA